MAEGLDCLAILNLQKDISLLYVKMNYCIQIKDKA